MIAGTMNDPDHLHGLAHLCEHALSLGSEKYPLENDYKKFVQNHGGDSNAHTFLDRTSYHFDIQPEFLEVTDTYLSHVTTPF